MSNITHLNVRVTKSQSDAIKASAKQYGLSLAEYVREVLGKEIGFDPDEVRSRGRQPGFKQAEWWLNGMPVTGPLLSTEVTTQAQGRWVTDGHPRQTAWCDIAIVMGEKKYLHRAKWQQGTFDKLGGWFVGSTGNMRLKADCEVMAWRPVDDNKWVYPAG